MKRIKHNIFEYVGQNVFVGHTLHPFILVYVTVGRARDGISPRLDSKQYTVAVYEQQLCWLGTPSHATLFKAMCRHWEDAAFGVCCCTRDRVTAVVHGDAQIDFLFFRSDGDVVGDFRYGHLHLFTRHGSHTTCEWIAAWVSIGFTRKSMPNEFNEVDCEFYAFVFQSK